MFFDLNVLWPHMWWGMWHINYMLLTFFIIWTLIGFSNIKGFSLTFLKNAAAESIKSARTKITYITETTLHATLSTLCNLLPPWGAERALRSQLQCAGDVREDRVKTQAWEERFLLKGWFRDSLSCCQDGGRKWNLYYSFTAGPKQHTTTTTPIFLQWPGDCLVFTTRW